MPYASFLGLVVLAALIAPRGLAAQSEAGRRLVQRTGTLGGARIHESSGVAASRRHPGVLWTHNDSGDAPLIYAVTLQGTLLGRFRVVGARAVDWEDLALGPCPNPWSGSRSCLYVGDIGDNEEHRTHVVLYVFPEPDVTEGDRIVRETEPALAIRVRYADGPHDAEALLVDPSGSVHIVTKGRGGRVLRYRVPRAALGEDEVTVDPAQTLPITPIPLIGRWVTGGAIAPGGRQVALRTFWEVYFLRPEPSGWVLDGAPCDLAGLEPQGEGIDYLDERELVLTSERGLAAEGVIHTVRCP